MLDLNATNPGIKMGMLYVGLSRTRRGDNIRLMPKHQFGAFDYLLKKQADMAPHIWLAGFNDEGAWSPDRAKAFYNTFKKECTEAKRKNDRDLDKRRNYCYLHSFCLPPHYLLDLSLLSSCHSIPEKYLSLHIHATPTSHARIYIMKKLIHPLFQRYIRFAHGYHE